MERASLLQSLAMHYLNERSTERMLPYNEDLVERVLFLLSRQKARLEAVRQASKVLEHIYRVEIERVEWLVTEYLLIRLEKLRSNFYLEEYANLSEAEQTYHQAYTRLNQDANIFISEEDIPDRVKKQPKPAYAGIYVLEDIPDAVIDNEPLSLSADDFLIANVRTISHLIDSMQVLIV
ncbi:hypothetical protein NEDG_00326 [Nematocida displodere]|uniref:DNA replication complex GINS protein SLD5 n=1 Tax=Nematocida displodere TaxID=1805483 RepID=A0A177EK68_9MICR|nr:hypothetical protein NEDG_00326 [Nematocida displodere]